MAQRLPHGLLASRLRMEHTKAERLMHAFTMQQLCCLPTLRKIQIGGFLTVATAKEFTFAIA